jgi:hypothetical protein
MGEYRRSAADYLDAEADSPPTLAPLPGRETTDGNSGLGEQLRTPNRNRRLADTGSPLEQDLGHV